MRKTQTHSPHIVIVDAESVRRQLLQTQLHYYHYVVDFSCSNEQELFLWMKESPDVLLISCLNFNEKPIFKIINNIRDRFKDIQLLAHVASGEVMLAEKLKKLGIKVCFNIKAIIESIEQIYPININFTNYTQKSTKIKTNQFNTVQLDPLKFKILQYASNGMSSKETATLLNENFFKIENLRKQVLRETNSRNITHAVAKAKDFGLLNLIAASLIQFNFDISVLFQ